MAFSIAYHALRSIELRCLAWPSLAYSLASLAYSLAKPSPAQPSLAQPSQASRAYPEEAVGLIQVDTG